MCGIVGYVGGQQAAPVLLEGLARLEYRGYDSAGVAVLGADAVQVHKAAGRVRALESSLPAALAGRVGIGHTRWATHGVPNDENAHPHVSEDGRIAVVHNGIIDNAATLRTWLQVEGVVFGSDTDTEVIAHLVARVEADTLEEKVLTALEQVEGTYGLAVLDLDHPDRIVVARYGSPLILGIGDGEMHVASDAAALVRYTRRIVHLDDGELATVQADGFHTFTADAQATRKQAVEVEWSAEDYEQGDHDHFM
ncbi:MAG: glutamine--fructose-6-phosphate aminotransferase, partial [Actinomycetota bacterium]|nr:glutamine--fructose-6-phosphate aminotransferase [Actinomycetota bacterium]